ASKWFPAYPLAYQSDFDAFSHARRSLTAQRSTARLSHFYGPAIKQGKKMSTTLLEPGSTREEQFDTMYVYSFGPWGAEGDQNMKNSLGGKGANLAEMCRLKLPVPAGFTISTEFCTVYLQGGK